MDEMILCEAAGIDGKFVLFSNSIQIIRGNAGNKRYYYFQGDKTLSFKYISGVQLRHPGTIRPGFLQVESVGGTESFQTLDNFPLFNRENIVKFTRQQEPAFIKFKEMLEERIAALQAGSGAAPSPYLIDIEKLGELKAKGLITEEEYQTKKNQLLALHPEA